MANPYDPMEGNTDWGYTGYGTGDPKFDGGWDIAANLAFPAVAATMLSGIPLGKKNTQAQANPSIRDEVMGVDNALGGSNPLGQFAASAAGNAPSLLDKFRQYLTDPKNLVNLASIVPALAAMSKSNGGGSAQEQALLDEALKRTQRVDPLHQAVTQLAFSRLPDSARQGISLTGK